MKSFKEVQEILGDLPAFPKIYLLGSTGAGKTTIVRNIIGTSRHSFPSVTQTRTTVASTEYVLSRNMPFKTTFIFKEEEEINRSLIEIIETAIQRGANTNNPNISEEERFEEVRSLLDQTPDERFRLKYIVSESGLDECAKYLFKNIMPMALNRKDLGEDWFQATDIKSEINHLREDLFRQITKKANEVCPEHDIFGGSPYILKNNDKDEFIYDIKEILKSEVDSISPIIEYARIEGNLFADWLPNDLEIIIIDGEGIGHNLKETKNSLSDRHLDFFSFSDSILLVEKGDDPFISGGKSAIETIFLNGYSNKFELLFTKLDKLEVKDKKRSLNTSISNVKNALNESNIQFDLDKNQKYYFSQLDKSIKDDTKKEIIRLLRTIIELFNQDTKSVQPLEYDFDSLFVNLDTKNFINRWTARLYGEHWAIIKAFNRRMVNQEGKYRYLKPILEFHELIMREINSFVQQSNSLDSAIYNAQNQMKQEFSKRLLAYVRKNLMYQRLDDWEQALSEYGTGAGKRRSNRIRKIYSSFVPDVDQMSNFLSFKNDIIKKMIESGAKQMSELKAVRIEKLEIERLFGIKNIYWELSHDVNLLIGKNGTGKSTILKIIEAVFNGDKEIIEQFGNPKITILLLKEYEDGNVNRLEVSKQGKSQNIDIVRIDTFDNKFDSKTNNENKESPLDLHLKEITAPFAGYLLKLKNCLDEKIKPIDDSIQEFMTGDNPEKKLQTVQNLFKKKNEIRNGVYSNLTTCQEIIDSLFKDTNKKIDFFSSEKGEIIIHTDEQQIDITQLSSGEKQLLIVMLTVLLRENEPYILLMDEPEISLHLEWQTTFIDNLRKLNPNIQIVIATHNPLLVLNRDSDEIGILENGEENVLKKPVGSKYLDVSATMLSFFGLSSLVGSEMRENIEELFRLKEIEPLSDEEQSRLTELQEMLDGTLATNFIYDRHYFDFLKFIKKNKNIDFDKFTEISEDEMNELLGEYKDQF